MATEHTHAVEANQGTWRAANTMNVTHRMTKYGDRTVNALRTLAAQGQLSEFHLGKGLGLHATAVKILKDDGIITCVTPGELAAKWEISPVGREVCLFFGIEITEPDMAEAEIAESLGAAWHGTNTCVNCGCDPQVPVYTLNRGFRFPMGKRARKQVKRAKRTRVGA
jgi:hypothetical protein